MNSFTVDRVIRTSIFNLGKSAAFDNQHDSPHAGWDPRTGFVIVYCPNISGFYKTKTGAKSNLQ
jgi:hypothetical protein